MLQIMYLNTCLWLVWYIFCCVQVYKGFLDELHFHGILKIADVDKIFANLSGLCEVSIASISQ